MMLRPRPARWFEALCPRSGSARLVSVLAATGAVEIDLRATHQGELRLRELTAGLDTYRALLPRYGRYWQRGKLDHFYRGEAPARSMQRALEGIKQWRDKADPLIAELQSAEDERYRLRRCTEVMRALHDSDIDFTQLNAGGSLLSYTAALLPKATQPLSASENCIIFNTPLPEESYLLAVGPAPELSQLEARIKTLGGRLLRPPPWLRGKPAEAKRQIERRLIELERDIAHCYAALDRLHEKHELPLILGALSDLEWFTKHIGVLELISERFALVTGWTDNADGALLVEALEAENVPALIHFPPPPPGAEAPQIFDNPPWVRPFEVFARAFGMPGGAEADPSPLLVLIAPLLFGYMFGDVGQGLVLFIAGWLLRKRWSLSWLLIAGGVGAMLFGLLFGSLFSLEQIIPALWMHPLEHPLTVLAVPLIFAVGLLIAGQCLNALEASWRRELTRWLMTDAGFLLMYLGIALFLFGKAAYWLPLIGLGWYLFGSAITGGLLHALSAAGELLERGMQIGVNTLSFARVGAFALAHAGLASAVVSLADAMSSQTGQIVMLILGNLLIIALEGLVVSIQTTRLILFEFFNRFLRGNGRVFRPVPPPPTVVKGES